MRQFQNTPKGRPNFGTGSDDIAMPWSAGLRICESASISAPVLGTPGLMEKWTIGLVFHTIILFQ
jgi:hypothetical protein